MDKIRIEELELYANHGVYPEETKLGQRFLLTLTLAMDTRMAGMSDELSDAVDYGEVSHFAVEYLKGHTFHLIEAAAEQLVRELLLKYPQIKEIQAELKKPWAPIGLPLQYVSVEISRSWHKVYLALGANMGDKEQNIRQGIKALSDLPECHINRVSELLVTKPYGVKEQDDFLNGCLEMETLFTPEELLDKLHEIETKLGRKRVLRWGPRTLDLDILFYDDTIMQTPDLVIPHIDMVNREFVLEPLAQIAPYLVHPICHKSIRTLLAELRERENANENDPV